MTRLVHRHAAYVADRKAERIALKVAMELLGGQPILQWPRFTNLSLSGHIFSQDPLLSALRKAHSGKK